MAKKETPAEATRRIRAKLQTEYVEDAFKALHEVVCDRAAPPAARASAGNTLARAGGFFDRSEAGKLEKEIHEMTLEELDERRRELQADGERSGAADRAGGNGDGAGDVESGIFD